MEGVGVATEWNWMPKGGELGSFLDSVQPDLAVTETHNHERQFCDICKRSDCSSYEAVP